MRDKEISLTVTPGQALSLSDIVLSPKPVYITLDSAFEPSCSVLKDGLGIGTVEEIHREVTLLAPEKEHIIVITCGRDVYVRKFLLPKSQRLVFSKKKQDQTNGQ